MEFAGYKLTQTSLGLSEKLFSSITEYPQPKTVKQMRGWIGLLNSLSNHTRELAILLNPLRHHICVSKNTKKKTLDWTHEDSENFRKCKEKVIQIMRNKIKYFILGNPLALITDWSVIGSGFILKQKTCKCKYDAKKINIDCCTGGWDTIQAGSRPNNKHEKNYKATEREALAVAIALERCKHYVQGTPITIVTDHAPLEGKEKSEITEKHHQES